MQRDADTRLVFAAIKIESTIGLYAKALMPGDTK
jgi:hypothetical protein